MSLHIVSRKQFFKVWPGKWVLLQNTEIKTLDEISEIYSCVAPCWPCKQPTHIESSETLSTSPHTGKHRRYWCVRHINHESSNGETVIKRHTRMAGGVDSPGSVVRVLQVGYNVALQDGTEMWWLSDLYSEAVDAVAARGFDYFKFKWPWTKCNFIYITKTTHLCIAITHNCKGLASVSLLDKTATMPFLSNARKTKIENKA